VVLTEVDDEGVVLEVSLDSSLLPPHATANGAIVTAAAMPTMADQRR
jgi:hypothetical protein